MIPQHTLIMVGDLCGSERQATGVGSEQDIDLILGDEALSQSTAVLGLADIVIGDQAQRQALPALLQPETTRPVSVLDPGLRSQQRLSPGQTVPPGESGSHANADVIRLPGHRPPSVAP